MEQEKEFRAGELFGSRRRSLKQEFGAGVISKTGILLTLVIVKEHGWKGQHKTVSTLV